MQSPRNDKERALAAMIDELELDYGTVRISPRNTIEINGNRFTCERPRIGRGSNLTISYDDLVIVDLQSDY